MNTEWRQGEYVADGRDASGVGGLVTRLADGLGKLVTDHITLARLELSQDARGLLKDVAGILVFAPFVLVGYGFLCAALAVALASFMSPAVAVLLVGLLNVIGGGAGIAIA